MDIIENKEERSRAWLVGIRFADEKTTENEITRHLDELKSLLGTLEVNTAGRTIAVLKKPSPAFLVGKGKVEEIISQAKEADADLIVFDDNLSPSQQRNWEEESSLKVIDRQEVIINIFAERASTKEASLQVELASCKYRLPRLAGAWRHLSRQRGGFYGTKGEGEKQIEIDRRLLLKKIAKLKEELEEVEKQRGTRRKLRSGKELFSCSIAGYTNAGKSTLINTLTGSSVSANNRLFDTLDPSTRKFRLPGGREIILTDTVGFIRKLPHQLVEAFKSTLEETLLSDLIILLLDASSSEVMAHHKASMDVLAEIGADKGKILIVFNKSDLCGEDITVSMLKREFPDSLFISAATGENIGQLAARIEKTAGQSDRKMLFLIPPDRYELLQLIRKTGNLISEEYTQQGAVIAAIVPEKTASQLKQYEIDQYSMEKPE